MILEEYQAEWTENFDKLAYILSNTLEGIAVEIEHIGSTAIPKLAAKPIIDIDIVYENAEMFEDIKKRLEKIGYYHNGNQGIEYREVFKRRKLILPHRILDGIAHHLYVCIAGSDALNNHILFRDFLRKNETARIEYQNLKYNIAKAANNNRKMYAAIKEEKASAFVDTIIKKARLEL